MKRFLMVLALGGAMFAGCGDDDDDDDDVVRPDAGDGSVARPDASTSDGGMDAARPDAGPDATVAVKVSNTGTACTMANAATTCMGTAAVCSQTIGFGATPPGGGFCSASCAASAECGATGSCPFGDLLNNALTGTPVRNGFAEAGVPSAALTLAQQCFAKCAAPGSQSTCATGYKCSTLKAEYASLAAAEQAGVPSVGQGICIPTTGLAPVPTPGDAGVGDAGRDAAVVQGMDSGL